MRIGLVGTGSMGYVHAGGWRKAGAKLVGIVSQSSETAARLADEYGATVFDSYEELLTAVDIVDLCVPTDLHRDMAIQAAQAGKHIFCEKPIALSVEDARAMISACTKAGVRLFVGMVVRFFPQYREAQKLVQAGQLGDLGVIRLKRVAYVPREGQTSWFADESRSGGMLVDLMVHDIDYARSLAGEVSRVFAKSVKQHNPDALGDYALVTLRFENGAMALIEGGWAYPLGVFRTGLDIAGSKGVIEWASDQTEPIHTFLKPTEQDIAQVGLPPTTLAEDPYTTEIKHFCAALEQGHPFDVSPEDATAALNIALAARESLRTGRSVAVETIEV